MGQHVIKKGLDLPITGDPEQSIDDAVKVSRVAVMADDYTFMKPRMRVKVGDTVKLGQPLFDDRKSEGVTFTAPGAGTVVAINRGRYRALQSVVIELADKNSDESMSFEAYSGTAPDKLDRDAVVALLVESGLWTAIRERPFGRTPAPAGDAPAAVFVNAADSNPGAAQPDVAIDGRESDFEAGLGVVSKLTSGKTFLCREQGTRLDARGVGGISVETFSGPHPAGTVGVHIHTLLPVSRKRKAWYLDYQDVAAIGHLFTTGKLDVRRVVALSGPSVTRPRLLRTRWGACLDEIVKGELEDAENRVISGSVLSGRAAQGEIHGFLGRHHSQISSLREDRERVLFGWLTLGKDAYSTSGIYLSQLDRKRKFDFTTTTNGSHRAMVPIGMYERVFPFDILPTFLLRSLMSHDLTRAEELGALEFEPEDLALCTFVSPGKEEYGKVLSSNLEQIWKEG
jgi:Na+-transporting NADH:ubiquinone oxidoreductase subunit A